MSTTMDTTTPEYDARHTQALSLRMQALKLLQKAQELDGLKPAMLTHEYRNGQSSYLYWAAGELPLEEVADRLGLNYDPDGKDEYLTTDSPDLPLDNLVGVNGQVLVLKDSDSDAAVAAPQRPANGST